MNIKLGHLKLEKVNHIKKVYCFDFSLLTLFYDEDIDLLRETPKECNSIFQIFIPLIALHFFLHKYV